VLGMVSSSIHSHPSCLLAEKHQHRSKSTICPKTENVTIQDCVEYIAENG
jgi:hypothetical protein